jgi:hypothetical protein
MTHMFLAALYTRLGRADEARTAAAEVLRLSPNFSLEGLQQRLVFKDPAITQRFIHALRQAGLG